MLNNSKFEDYFGLGRRKEAVAQVFLKPSSLEESTFCVKTGTQANYREFTASEYFKNDFWVQEALSPINLSYVGGNFNVLARIRGGGKSAQAQAIKLGITRALLSFSPELRGALKMQGLITRDSRVKERKKVGKYGARRSPQFTKR